MFYTTNHLGRTTVGLVRGSSARSSRQGWCTVGEGGGGLQGYSAVLAIPKNNKPINPLQTVQVRNPVTRNLPRPPGRPLRKDRAGRKGGCVRKFCRSTGQYFACIFRYIYIYIYIYPSHPPPARSPAARESFSVGEILRSAHPCIRFCGTGGGELLVSEGKIGSINHRS